jgi:ferredoxin-NADP reductase
VTINVVERPRAAVLSSVGRAVASVASRRLGNTPRTVARVHERAPGDIGPAHDPRPLSSPPRIVALRRADEPMESPGLAPADDPVCQCMQVDTSTLINAVEGGCRTVHALSIQTGAGTVCGGCLPRLAELTAETLSQTVHCLEVIHRAPRVRSFRFEVPSSHRIGLIRPGQRLIVRAMIDGVMVQRPYTLTSAATERRHYEITVQREPHGVMSNWLFDRVRPGSAVTILPPSGTCFVDLREQRPLVCLVGGIGVTPALAICRSAAASGSRRRVHVDYSVSTRGQIVCADELVELTSRHPTITWHTRITAAQGRFQAEDLARLAVELADCDWLVCGSKSFQADAERLLIERGIAPRHIHIESFRAFDGATPAEPAATALMSPWQRSVLGYAMLVVLAAFVAQALLGVKWLPLDRLQATTAYSALTGTALMGLLMLQWRLAYVRLRNRAANTAWAYGLHVAIGPAVLAMIWLHSARLGYGLSLAVCLNILGSLATGALLAANPRSPRWEAVRGMLLGGHISLSLAGSGLAVAHGLISLWY